MKRNTISKVYDELEIIQALTKLSNSALEHESKEAIEDYIKLVFEEMERRYKKVFELVKQWEQSFIHSEN